MQDFRMETFLAVCRNMNFTKTAKELNITQPAVSQHIHYLEQHYGVPLFSHKGKKIILTEAGEILKNSALTMKHDEFHMKQRMEQTINGTRSYSFGATLTVAEYMTAENLCRFISTHPDSHIQMLVGNTKELLRKLDTGELDFAIVEGDFPKIEYDYFLYSTEEYVAAAAPEKARLYHGRPVNSLLPEFLLVREEGSGTREILEQYLKNHGLSLADFSNLNEIGNINVLKRIITAGQGISFLYRAAIKQEEADGKLEVIELKDFKLTHEIMFIFRKDSIFKEDYEKIFYELKTQ